MVKKAKDLIANRTGANNHKRRVNAKHKGEITLIVCEGTITEIQYFKDMIRELGLRTAQVKVAAGKKSDPCSVVKTAIDIYDKRNEFEKIFVVVDVDHHGKNLQTAKTNLKQHSFAPRIKDGSKIKKPIAQILVSNPCIEVWFILHYELLQKPLSDQHKLSKAKSCKKHLADKHISGYQENTEGLYYLLKSKQQTAFDNVNKLEKLNVKHGTDELSTDVHILCKHLNDMSNH